MEVKLIFAFEKREIFYFLFAFVLFFFVDGREKIIMFDGCATDVGGLSCMVYTLP